MKDLNHQYKYMKEIGSVVGFILKSLKKEIKPGMSGKDLEKIARDLMREKKVKSSIFNYKGFPGYICVSLNHVITHGIPNQNPFKKGDIISIDVACHKKDKKGISYHADAALTTVVGEEANQEQIKLLEITKRALKCAIESIQPGITTNHDIGKIIKEEVEKTPGFYVIKEFGGHGIGNEMHLPPFIPNSPLENPNKESVLILPNTAICIEPLVQTGNAKIKLSSDG